MCLVFYERLPFIQLPLRAVIRGQNSSALLMFVSVFRLLNLHGARLIRS